MSGAAFIEWSANPIFNAMVPSGQPAGAAAEWLRRLWLLPPARYRLNSEGRILQDEQLMIAGETYQMIEVGGSV